MIFRPPLLMALNNAVQVVGVINNTTTKPSDIGVFSGDIAFCVDDGGAPTSGSGHTWNSFGFQNAYWKVVEGPDVASPMYGTLHGSAVVTSAALFIRGITSAALRASASGVGFYSIGSFTPQANFGGLLGLGASTSNVTPGTIGSLNVSPFSSTLQLLYGGGTGNGLGYSTLLPSDGLIYTGQNITYSLSTGAVSSAAAIELLL
jgi:hypothetical protein